MKVGLFLLAGQFPGMTEGAALAGAGMARFEHGFPESLDLLVAALENGHVAADGCRFFSFRPVTLVPGPAMAGRPQVTVAATTLPTVEVAAARGVPLLLGLHADDEEKAAFLGHYAGVAAAHGHDPGTVEHVGAVVGHVADSRAEALAELRAAMPAWISRGVGGYVSLLPEPRPCRDARAYVEHLVSFSPVGTPDQCAQRLSETLERTGLRHLIVMVEGAGDPGRTRENITRLGAEVLPRLRGTASSASR